MTDGWQTDDERRQSQVNQNEEYNREDDTKTETRGSNGLADRTELEGMKGMTEEVEVKSEEEGRMAQDKENST